MDEVCDDGVDNGNNRLCKSDCTPAFCGDGYRLSDISIVSDERFEYCDDGNDISINDGCNTDCELTENRENLEPPEPDICRRPSIYDAGGRACRLDGEGFGLDDRLSGGSCLLGSFVHKSSTAAWLRSGAQNP